MLFDCVRKFSSAVDRRNPPVICVNVPVDISIFVGGTMCMLTDSAEYLARTSDRKIVLTLPYVPIACAKGGYMLQNIALKYVSPGITEMVQCLYPVATATIAYFVLKARLTLPGMVGVTVIIVATLQESAQDSEKEWKNGIDHNSLWSIPFSLVLLCVVCDSSVDILLTCAMLSSLVMPPSTGSPTILPFRSIT